MKKHPPKIGIVSGIGPLAGSDVFAKLLKYAADTFDAVEDSQYPDVVLVSHGIEGVDNIGTLNPQFEKDIVSMVSQLEQNQANIIGIACNTAHIYLGLEFLNRTFSIQEDDPIVDVEEIRELLDEEIKEGDNE
jgi:aspartate/glutamate racemase